jgi:hypothetical protein
MGLSSMMFCIKSHCVGDDKVSMGRCPGETEAQVAEWGHLADASQFLLFPFYREGN